MMKKANALRIMMSDAHHQVSQGHKDPNESKGPPNWHQMHALDGWPNLRLQDGEVQ
jgi:hypothetical protein